MADDLVLNAGSGGGTVRAFQDASDVYWPGGVTCFLTSVGTPDVAVPVLPTQGLPVRLADGSGYLSALPVTDNGGSLTVDGTVAVSGSVAVTGTFWQAEQPVSLASVPSHAVTNAGTFAVQAAQSGTWSVTDGGGSLTVDGPLTDAQLRASEVAVLIEQEVAVANTGTFAVQVTGAALTALQLIDDVVYTDDTSTHASGTSKGVLLMAAATPTDASVSANDIGAVGMTTDRKLHVSVQDALPAGTNAIGKLASNTGVTIGAVEIASAQTLGTVTTVGTVTTCSTVTTVSTLTGGGVAHDGADSGNPVKVGARATNVNLAAVANNDRSDLVADLTGKLVTSPYSVPEVTLDGTASATNTSDTAVIAAQGAGVRIYVTTLVLANSSSTNITVTIKSATTAKMVVPVPANGGVVVPLPKPLRLAANEALNFAASSGVTTAYCSAVGYAAA
jgi:hypothetical protein